MCIYEIRMCNMYFTFVLILFSSSWSAQQHKEQHRRKTLLAIGSVSAGDIFYGCNCSSHPC